MRNAIRTLAVAVALIALVAVPKPWQVDRSPQKGWLDAQHIAGQFSFMPKLEAQGYSTGAYFVPYSGCGGVVSGNASGTNGITTAGTSLTPVFQESSSVTGTNTHTYVCDITPPGRFSGTTGPTITGADFFYGVQTTGLGTQAVVLASGTLNSVIVFGKIAMPSPAASETPSTVAPVRADSGTMTLTPVAASFNVATTTAGAFATQRFTPGAAFATTTLTKYLLTVALLNTATSATITNTPGAIVYTQ